jgi:hypothetical protein
MIGREDYRCYGQMAAVAAVAAGFRRHKLKAVQLSTYAVEADFRRARQVLPLQTAAFCVSPKLPEMLQIVAILIYVSFTFFTLLSSCPILYSLTLH